MGSIVDRVRAAMLRRNLSVGVLKEYLLPPAAVDPEASAGTLLVPSPNQLTRRVFMHHVGLQRSMAPYNPREV